MRARSFAKKAPDGGRFCFYLCWRPPEPAQFPDRPRQRQADDRQIVAFDPFDKQGGAALDAIRPRLVHRLPGRNIGGDFLVIELPKRDCCFFRKRCD
ncbi:hypothetical protein DI44_13235 [Geobacillus sp. CAMR5420]|nr:hypothetical protein DI44_13235 [Geobacillus sp. CAMR5420]